MTRQALNNLVNEKSGISPEMSIRLSKAFGSRPELWLGMQMEYDLAQAEKNAGKIKVKRITATHASPRSSIETKVPKTRLRHEIKG